MSIYDIIILQDFQDVAGSGEEGKCAGNKKYPWMQRTHWMHRIIQNYPDWQWYHHALVSNQEAHRREPVWQSQKSDELESHYHPDR